MANDVEIRLIANGSQAANEIKKVTGSLSGVEQQTVKTTKATQQQTKASSALSDAFKGNITQILGTIAASASLAVIFNKVVSEVKSSVTEFLRYTDQVRLLSQVTGTSAEATSRLIQVTDDYKISAEQVTAASRFLARQGLTPTIETLAKLSDQYVTLGSGAERTAFLVKNFGRAGLAFNEIMAQGSAAILARNAAVEKGLIVTNEMLQQARDLQTQQDMLNDTWAATKYTLANQLVPQITKVGLGYIMLTKLMELNRDAAKGGAASHMTLAQRMDAAAQAAADEFNAQRILNKSLKDGQEAADDAAAAEKALSEGRQNLLSIMGSLQSAQDQYDQAVADTNAKQGDLIAKQNEAVAALQLAIRQGYSPAGQHVTELKQKLGETTQAIEENADAQKKAAGDFETASRRIVVSMLQQKLAADGMLSTDEFNMLVDLQVQWGLLSQKTADEAKAIDATTTALAGATAGAMDFKTVWDSIHDKSVNLSVNVRTTTITAAGGLTAGGQGAGGGGGRAVLRAAGGQLGKDWSIVGEKGYEAVSPTGRVVPHEQTRAMLAAGMLRAARGFVTGGQLISQLDDPTVYANMPTGVTGPVSNISQYTNYTTGGGGGHRARTAANTAASVIAANTAVTRQAVAASTDASVQAAAAMVEQTRQNGLILEAIANLNRSIPRAVRDAVAGIV